MPNVAVILVNGWANAQFVGIDEVSANPSVTIEHFDVEPSRTGVAEGGVASSRGSVLSARIVARLYAAAVVPAMMGWLYLLAVSFFKFIKWMIS